MCCCAQHQITGDFRLVGVMRTLLTNITAATIWVLGAALASSTVRGEPASLYARLGGQDGVRAIAVELIDRVVADPRLGRSFEDSNIPRVKDKLAEQICQLSGGPCQYSGDSMRETHAGHHITESEFYGVVDTLRDVLRRRHVGLAEENELLRLLAPMKRDIVEGPKKNGAQRKPGA
jgi:hemoglobin